MTDPLPIDPRTNNLGYFSWAAAQRRPDAVAIIDLSRSPAAEIRYRTLEERLNRVAALLERHGLKPGDRLAMAVGNRFEFIEVMYGAMRAGVVPVPLNTKLGADVLEYILKDAGCIAAVVEPATNPWIVDVAVRHPMRARFGLGTVPPGWLDYQRELQAAPAEFDPPDLADDHPSFQPYTSGSTGRPKGVILTHAGQMWWIRTCHRYWPMAETDRALTAVPLYHKNAMAGAVKTVLHAGAATVILPNFEPRRFLETLSSYRCTHSGGVPAVFTLLLQQKDLLQSLDFSALKSLKIGSAPTARELQEAVEAAFGVPVRESYGLTEGGPVMVGSPIDGSDVPKGSCGVAWPEGEVKLIGPDGKESQTYGELWVRNPGVTPGYHNLPEVNRERLVDGWLRTGDLFSRDAAGFFFFKGRTDDMFKSGGETIYPLEVEGLLLTHPDVADVSVVPVPHAIKGEVPVAVVVKRRGSAIDEKDLKEYSLNKGPAYAHPRRVLFVDALPLNGAAKTDRTAVNALVTASLGDGMLGREEARVSGFDLDHVGILVKDLDKAAAQFRRLGFKLTPRGYHTLPATAGGERPRVGTGNNCAMLRRGYVELIGITDPRYEGRMRADLDLYEGLHLVAFGTSDAMAAAQGVRAAGFHAADPRIMERPIEEELARFEIVDFPPDTLPGSHLFAIRHATPDLLWKPELMIHPNGAERLEAVVIAAEDPAKMAVRLGRLLSIAPLKDTLSLAAGRLRFVDAAWIAAHIPGRSPALPFIAGLSLGVRDLDATADWLTASGVGFERFQGGLRVAPSEGCGAFIEFVG